MKVEFTHNSEELHYVECAKQDADALVLKFHYSHRLAANVQFVGGFCLSGGLFGDFGEMVAACFFSIPPTRWSEDVLELSRLVRKDGVKIPLTSLISKCCSSLKVKGFDLLVSFADAQQSHHGGIYQACSWNYHGQRETRIDGLVINGKFTPGRTCNSLWGTSSPQKLKEKFPQWNIEPHYDIGKHLYWKSLKKSGEQKAARLKLEKNQYPKPNK